MPAEVTWILIGQSFLWLALGAGLLALALLVIKRWPSRWRWLWVPVSLMALPPLALWLLMLFGGAYPTIHQTDDSGPRCLSADGVQMDCESEVWQELWEGE